MTCFSSNRGSLADRLRKKDSYPIVELSYLEVGLGSQSIHMKFADGGVAYTLLVRDSVRCKRFFGLLTGKTKQKSSLSASTRFWNTSFYFPLQTTATPHVWFLIQTSTSIPLFSRWFMQTEHILLRRHQNRGERGRKSFY